MNRDKEYLEVCEVVAKTSNCLSRQVGAVLVRNGKIISYGWNHTPECISSCRARYIMDDEFVIKNWLRLKDRMYQLSENGPCPRQFMGYKSGEGLEWCPAIHAEVAAILNAARAGIRTAGSTMYMNCNFPCKDCFKEIEDAGIEEIVCKEIKYYDKLSKFLHKYSNVKVRTYNVYREP